MAKCRSFRLNISGSTIASATPNDSTHCMIAQAARKIGCSSVHVTAETVSFNHEEKRYHFPLPAFAVTKLVMYDKKGPKSIKPFYVILNGNTGSVMDIEKRKKRGKHKVGEREKRGPYKAKRCKRRFHGVRVIEVPVGTVH